MTAYLVFDYLKQGRAKLTDELPVSERAWRTGGSKMFVPIGSRIKIEDLVRGMVVQSGNDACVVLAEGLAGSEAAFLEQMNQKAEQIGLKDSHFANVDGLPNPDHWMTAHDLATLALRTIKELVALMSRHDLAEIDLREGEVRLRIRRARERSTRSFGTGSRRPTRWRTPE